MILLKALANAKKAFRLFGKTCEVNIKLYDYEVVGFGEQQATRAVVGFYEQLTPSPLECGQPGKAAIVQISGGIEEVEHLISLYLGEEVVEELLSEGGQ